MAAGKSAAVEAYERAEDEMRKHQARVAKARKTAARELGDTVLATGAGKLPVAQLKAILGAVVTMGGDPGARRARGHSDWCWRGQVEWPWPRSAGAERR